MFRISLPLLALAVLLSGCAFENGPGGQSASGTGDREASLNHNGASSGTHRTDPVQCDGSGTVNHNTNLGSGRIDIRVKDSSSGVIGSKSVSGPGQTSSSFAVDGAAGAWILEVQRSGGFSGQYNINLVC